MMPRYVNQRGVEINTSEEVAGRLGLKPKSSEPRRQAPSDERTAVRGDRKPPDEDQG